MKYRVKLNNPQQNIHIEGKILKHGDIFIADDRYRQNCVGIAPTHDAFLEILEEDKPVSKSPKIINQVIRPFSSETIEYAMPPNFIIITNRHPTQILKSMLNDDEAAILETYPNESHTFNKEEFSIKNIKFINQGQEEIKVQITFSI